MHLKSLQRALHPGMNLMRLTHSRRICTRTRTRQAGFVPGHHLNSYEKGIELNIYGNEIYYTAYSLLVILKNSCCKLQCKKGFDLIIFSQPQEVTADLGNRSVSWSICSPEKPTMRPTPENPPVRKRGANRPFQLPRIVPHAARFR